ncbi:fructosamine kinase family protein [Nocardia sp. NBC_01503]|uniref:fructosamine kinase family protein n=1 Tax=Nocardia sp. NBC_01503 TaxID=2975997 RepID=UPI002E7C2558|nr:fructosamine kinase family protein [Nocardia sp. NBC_01503]WTL31405.1 fructosamine kinase family protein [Nocardia sp. NBC_01503]
MDVTAHLTHLTGASLAHLETLGRSHAWTLYRAQLADGREVFVKAIPEAPEPTTGNPKPSEPVTADPEPRSGTFAASGALRAEAAGLRWLGEADIDLVPPVLAADRAMLVLPWLTTESASPAVAEKFGHDLAEMHALAPETYGAPWTGYIATLPLDNAPSTGEWGSWYAERRLAPYLPAAEPHLGRAGVRLIEEVIRRIDDLAGPPEPPSRLHGDLWSGNLLWTADRAILIDPAAHGGHRETDLAMLALFGAPHLDRIVAAYHDRMPLSSGWRQRIPLHQLHPLFVHVALFGGTYRGMLLAAAAAALRG